MTSLPPHNLDAEMSVLGVLLMQNDQLETALEQITEMDFYLPKHQLIFKTFRELARASQAFDLITVSNSLRIDGAFERIGGSEYLAQLIDRSLEGFHFEGHCLIIKETSMARQIISLSQDVQGRAFKQDFQSVSELIEYTQRRVLQLDQSSSSQNTLHPIHDVMKNSIKQIEHRYNSKDSILGISTGFKSLDEIMNGLKPGELVVVGARPSMGKTAFSLCLAVNIALAQKKRLAYFSIEMPKETLVMRMLAASAGIALDRVMTGRISDTEWPRLIRAASDIADCDILIDESNPLSPHEIKARCRRAKVAGGLDCVMVDYLQMMKVKDQRIESREREVAEISSSLKALAKELQVPVIALAQLNRELGKRNDKRPSLTDLSGSGTIEMDADIAVFLHREEYYDREDPNLQGLAELIVAKNRNGKTGIAKMRFESSLNRFRDL
jgi:replicative DNA helicase